MTNALQAINLSLPMGNLDAYIAATKRIPLLTAQEEHVLAERWYYHQDIDAARQLIMTHLRFVISIAKSYAGYGLMLADLIQEGNIGLMKAVKRFNPTLGVRLVSFAVHWIKAEIHEFIIKNWRIVKIATTKTQRKLFFKLRSLQQRLGNNLQAIAENLGVHVKSVQEMDTRLQHQDADIEVAYDMADHGADPSKQIEAYSQQENHQARLIHALETLDTRSRDILNKRWLSENKSTLHELATDYNVSAERIRQLEKNAMKKLKQAMTI